MAYWPGGQSSAASAAIESLLPSISVSKKKVPGKSAEIVRASITLPGLNEQTDLEDWRAVLECAGARKIWDPMVESSTVLMTLDDSTCITKTIFKTNWPASPRDALLIETTLLDHNAVLHIATSIKPSEDDPIFLRPSPPHVRAYLPLVVWHIQLVPAEMEDTISFTSFTSLSTSQNKPVMPRHSIRVSFYYQIDMRGWAVNSSVSMQSHVPSCIANVYRLLRRQGVPPHVSRHSPRIQLDLNEYDPATGIYELRYDVIPADSDSPATERKTISSALRQFRLGTSNLDEGLESIKEEREPPNVPQEILLSDDEDDDELNTGFSGDKSSNSYVDVELDGEKWGQNSDIVVHIFMNDIEDEEFVREHVECLKYMGRDRYILRMKHTDVGTDHGAINVKLLIKRIPQQSNSGGTTLISHQQLLLQREQQEQEQEQEHGDQDQPQASDLNGLSVSVNGHEKNILPLHRPPVQAAKRGSMSVQEQLDLGQQIVQEVDNDTPHSRGGSDGPERLEGRIMSSPLLLMSSSMSATMHSIGRSNQSVLSNGTSTMTPGNSNPTKVNSSYNYFSSLLQEPVTSWKALTKQRGVQVSKLETQGHAPGIVKGEGVFEDYTIWDIKAALDCVSARKIWDKMFEDSHLLQQISPSSILSYLRLKGFWPTSPKDMAVLSTTFVTKEAIHFFATSVDDTNQYPSIPPPQSPFVRSELVVSGWYLETIKPRSVRITYIAQATPTSWVVPGTALGAMTTEMPLCVAEIIKYLETNGSPPTLVSIRRGRALTTEYSHTKSSFRLEYVPDSNPIFSGQKVLQQQQGQNADRNRKSVADFTAGTGGPEGSPFNSPKLGPTEKLLAEIRLDARLWAKNGDCEITIDPPPSKVVCSCAPHDSTGYRLRIEHSGGRAVPAGGKVLLMARKATTPGCGFVVNGVAIKVPNMEHLDAWTYRKGTSDKDRTLTLSMVDGVLSEKENQDEDEDDGVGLKTHSKGSSTAVSGDHTKSTLSGEPDEDSEKKQSASLMTPLQYAQSALDLLAKIKADPEDAWTVVSDSKGGLKVTKRFMPAEISDQVPLVRGEKVIEGFSLEEIATVIGTLGTRSELDSLFDSGEMLESFGAGCAVFHHVLRSLFPLPLPARDLFLVTVTASAEVSARCPQIVILSTSIPPESVTTIGNAEGTSGTTSSKPSQPRPRAHLHLSAWILECIDPYSSGHPIPSTRVTYMTALDLGGSVPQRISGMLQTSFPKMITQVESYLQLRAAPPIVRIPEQMTVGQYLDERTSERPIILPPVWPWNKPANRILSWEFKLKDSFCQISLLFDQFRLQPSKLDIAADKRLRKSKKSRRKSRNQNDSSRMDSNEQEDNEGAEAKEENTTSRTVLELVVDLKEYPMGYNIITNIKVDPEFLLQHKQQRDLTLRQHSMGSISISKMTGSASSVSIATATSAASTKFIGGFDSVGSAIEGHRRTSLDGELGSGSRGPSSEAASSGTGIAAVLGGSASVPRALPSSTSLIRILPPPVTVKVVDIPPAPSHSSSLSGISKRRKHLIIITVPEPEQSVSYVNAQQQGSTTTLFPKGGAPHIVSGTTAKPVVTASSVNGTTTVFNTDERADSKQGRQQPSNSSTNDIDSVIDALKPSSSPGMTPTTPELLSKRSPQQVPTASELETRMFQFGVKIDRLEHKDMDHSALQVAKDSLNTTSDEKEWSGKVMVDGLPVEVLTGWSRQELGFLDGVMEDGDGRERRRSRRVGSSGRRSSRYSGARPDQETEDIDSDEYRHTQLSGNEDDGENHHRRSSSNRKKKHHLQQLANSDMDRRSGSGSSHRAPTRVRSIQQSPQADDVAGSSARPSSSMYGLSNLLMNVGLLGYGSTRVSSQAGGSVANRDRKLSTLEHDVEEDDNDTIRANKSVSRSRLSGILNSSGSKKKHGKNALEGDHDLDLESLHGSIVFNDHDDSSDHVHEDDASHTENQRNGSIRRRNGKQVVRDDNRDEHSSSDHTTDTEDQSERDSEYDSETRPSRTRNRGRSSRSSTYQQRSRRHVSTNGADHPRFRGSKLYAYSFRNLVWTALACFLLGLLLRVFVIGPSFLKTVGPSSGSSSATYYYYFHAPRTTESSSSRPLFKDSAVAPSGIRELFTIRRVFGWDVVLLAYPSSSEAQ
ncbi:hypothetical protein BGX31_005244 [Mortierella sp. GBA43]|nr:hypothetical protein BGX31_005244 [Mortierella sp. GBA43]